MLAVFSVLLEESEEKKIADLCLEGFKNSIKISAHFDMHTERDAFVSTLGKFTSLSNLREIKEKNIDCIKILLELAVKEGNSLKNSWMFVLECISKLMYLQLVATGAKYFNNLLVVI
jgi:brefeldin A-inhibited guanine nucleotide-exchange protein